MYSGVNIYLNFHLVMKKLVNCLRDVLFTNPLVCFVYSQYYKRHKLLNIGFWAWGKFVSASVSTGGGGAKYTPVPTPMCSVQHCHPRRVRLLRRLEAAAAVR